MYSRHLHFALNLFDVYAQMDRLAISMAIVIFAFLGFMPPHSLAKHTPVAYAGTAALMLFLLGFAWIAHPRYAPSNTTKS